MWLPRTRNTFHLKTFGSIVNGNNIATIFFEFNILSNIYIVDRFFLRLTNKIIQRGHLLGGLLGAKWKERHHDCWDLKTFAKRRRILNCKSIAWRLRNWQLSQIDRTSTRVCFCKFLNLGFLYIKIWHIVENETMTCHCFNQILLKFVYWVKFCLLFTKIKKL